MRPVKHASAPLDDAGSSTTLAAERPRCAPAGTSLSEADARALTDQAKGLLHEIGPGLLDLYEGGAHLALGYRSWGAYFKAEFEQDGSYGYRLVVQIRIRCAVRQLANDLPLPNEAQARELAPLLAHGDEVAGEAWRIAVDDHGDTVTAKKVREVVSRLGSRWQRPTAPQKRRPLPAADVSVFKPGQIRQYGNSIVMCGDSTNPEHVHKLLDGRTVTTIFADPPYGIAHRPMRGNSRIVGDDNPEMAAELVETALKLVPAQHHFVCCHWRHAHLIDAAMTAAGATPKAKIIWDQIVRAQNLDLFGKRHEEILYAGPYGGERTVDDDVWAIRRDPRPRHQTAKPVELIERAILNTTKPGDVVYDPFAGSGPTLIAAEQSGRIACLMEIEPVNCAQIAARYAEYPRAR